jgi:hypothetical protein
MTEVTSAKGEIEVVKGEFITDGKTFVFHLPGTPFSGIGSTPADAYQDLMRIGAQTDQLSKRMKELARDQQGEIVRATIIRMSMIGLIVFGVVGGALFGAAAIFPRVAADISENTITQIARWIDDLPADRQEKISHAVQRIGDIFGRTDKGARPEGRP